MIKVVIQSLSKDLPKQLIRVDPRLCGKKNKYKRENGSW